MTLKEYIYKLSDETRKQSDIIESKEKQMESIDFIRELARNNGKLQILNEIILFMIKNNL